MKEFENDNWVIKVKHLADAFQPQPDKAVWLNVEAAIAGRKKRKGFFLFLYSLTGVAIICVGVIILKSTTVISQKDVSQSVFVQNEIKNAKVISDPSVVKNSNAITISSRVDKTEFNNTEKIISVTNAANHNNEKAINHSNSNSNIHNNGTLITDSSEINNLKTIIKENEYAEAPDMIVAEEMNAIMPMPLKPVQACSFAFRDEPAIVPVKELIVLDYINEKKNKWSIMIASSTLIQQSDLINTDTVQYIEKLPTHYFDGSVHLICQIPKWQNLELNIGAGFYEMNQRYSLEKILPPTNTVIGNPALQGVSKSYSEGSEFCRSAFMDFQLSLPVFYTNKFTWNISSGISAEYLMKQSADNSGVGVLQFSGQFSNHILAAEDLYPNANIELNRVYLKALLCTNVRFSLSKHFSLQSGIETKYAITDRYKKSSTLQQRDLNYGLNAGLIYKCFMIRTQKF